VDGWTAIKADMKSYFPIRGIGAQVQKKKQINQNGKVGQHKIAHFRRLIDAKHMKIDERQNHQ